METIKVQKNQIIAKQKDMVRKWYIVLEGSVVQMNTYARVLLEKNSVIGISESGRYLCDYIAREDSVLGVFPYESPDDLKTFLNGQENLRTLMLRAALKQRQMLLETYARFHTLVRQFHSFVETEYNDYTLLCAKYQMEGQPFSRIDYFKPLEMVHKAENWEVNNSTSLVKGYLDEYLQLMQKDDSLCIGALMEAAYQMRRVMQGLIEMVDYLKYNQDILLSESENDLFRLYFELIIQVKAKQYDAKPITDRMDRMIEVIRKLNIYDEKLVLRRLEAYQNYDYTKLPENGASGEEEPEDMEEDGGTSEDCLLHILTYAGYSEQDVETARTAIAKYQALPDQLSTEAEAFGLRKQLTAIFYEAYYKAFMRAMKQPEHISAIVKMFLNFGFMDVQMAGEENANVLHDLTAHLDLCNSNHIFTIFEWLKSIYRGENEPSKNEFDLDYNGYLAELRKTGKIRPEQVKEYASNREMKVRFEIQNMFTSGNRATYGKISTFCPILSENDMINSVDKMLVTAQKLDAALDKIRAVDFSVFYREVIFSDPDRGINREMIMKEVLPNIILMPNPGTRAMMWQETAGVKRDTPARFMMPIFTAVDLDDMMIETVGRYRWEICRKIQGVHWNDIRERSLTSEYCDYLQFYRKNHELSPDAKEKIKLALVRGKNNYREVFTKDYQNWIKYEAKGSFRLNKIARDILVSYCPFAKAIREDLKANPMYQSALHRFDVQNAKKIQRINGVYDKYTKSGGTITQELKDNLDYYSL
ncbi:MAG: cyclic nucleotide-binding domain-containing protein [Roseburia sp.]